MKFSCVLQNTTTRCLTEEKILVVLLCPDGAVAGDDEVQPREVGPGRGVDGVVCWEEDSNR